MSDSITAPQVIDASVITTSSESAKAFADEHGYTHDDITWIRELLLSESSIDVVIDTLARHVVKMRHKRWTAKAPLEDDKVIERDRRVTLLRHVRHALMYTGKRQGE